MRADASRGIGPSQVKAPTGTGATPAATQGLSGTNAHSSYRVAGHGESRGSTCPWAPTGRVASTDGYPLGSMRLTFVAATVLRLVQASRTPPGSFATTRSRGGEMSMVTGKA